MIRSIEFTTWYGKPEVNRTAAFSDCSSVSTSARYQGSYQGSAGSASPTSAAAAAAAAAASAKASTFAIDESVDVGAVRWNASPVGSRASVAVPSMFFLSPDRVTGLMGSMLYR